MRLVLFDIDGTLIRAGTTVHRAAFAHAFRTVYDLDLTLDGLSAAGRTDTWLLHEPLRGAGLKDEYIRELMPRAFAEMGAYVDLRLGSLRDNVLPGVQHVLQSLQAQGVMLGLLTGNLSSIAHAKMRSAGLDRYFDLGGFGEESEVRSDLVPVALSKAGEGMDGIVDPRQVVIVGDTPLDIEAGSVHGVRTCGVATGPFDQDALRAAGADLVLPSLQGAEDAILKLTGEPLRRR
jgi:phosphoglycolate phosphatase